MSKLRILKTLPILTVYYYTGETVTEMVTIDEEWGEQSYTYKLLDDAGGLFYIQNNTLRAHDLYDHETQKDSTWQITLRSTDSGTPPLSVG